MVTKVSANPTGTSEPGMFLHMDQILTAPHQPIIGGRQPSEQRSDLEVGCVFDAEKLLKQD